MMFFLLGVLTVAVFFVVRFYWKKSMRAMELELLKPGNIFLEKSTDGPFAKNEVKFIILEQKEDLDGVVWVKWQRNSARYGNKEMGHSRVEEVLDIICRNCYTKPLPKNPDPDPEKEILKDYEKNSTV